MRSVKWLFFFAGILIVSLSLRKPDALAGSGKTAKVQGKAVISTGLAVPAPVPASAGIDLTDRTIETKVNWITLKQAEDSMRINPKPILIDLYTSWCGWCKVMDKKTYSNKNVSEYLQRKFYNVKLDAETRKEIYWQGKRYLFNPDYRTNDFAVFLTKGQLSYPTTIIIPADNGNPQAIPGYLEPKEFELIVKYFGEDKFGKIPFEAYTKTFKASW